MEKRIIQILILIIPLLSSAQGNGVALAEEGLKRITASVSGVIEYEITGDATGTMTYEFTEWGWQESSLRTLEYSLYTLTEKEIRQEIRDGDLIFTINVEKQEGEKRRDRTLSDLLRYKSPEEAIEAIYITMGGTKTGTEEFLGREVNVWKFDEGKLLEVWEWKGLELKGRKKLANLEYTFSATNIDLEKDVSIAIPEGITWAN